MQVTTGRIEPKKPAGLVDGGHVILKCSNCDKPLVDVLITRPNDPFEWKVVAKCCYCGDKSVEHTIKGRFAPNAIVRFTDEDENDYVEVTKITRWEQVGDQSIFHTVEVK
jgi:hypothetical protein